MFVKLTLQFLNKLVIRSIYTLILIIFYLLLISDDFNNNVLN